MVCPDCLDVSSHAEASSLIKILLYVKCECPYGIGSEMPDYPQNILYAVVAMMGFGLAGGFAILPFRKSPRFILLSAPFAGILLTTLAALALYVVLKLSMQTAGFSSWIACCCITCASAFLERTRIRGNCVILSVVAVVCVTVILTTVFSAISIKAGGCALALPDGTDHLGYAHLADWLGSRSPPFELDLDQKPDDRVAYESWPLIMRLADPRFGSFTFLSLISILSHRSGMFAYDLGCAVALSAAVLALSGLFAKNWVALIFLLVGLGTCHWFDYGRCGFFAKSIAFPASFFVAGLFFLTVHQRQNRFITLVLTMLCASAALMLSGLTTALFLATLGGTFLFADFLFPPDSFPYRVHRSYRGVLLLFGLMTVAVLASGVFARPLHETFPDWQLSWEHIFSRISEIETQAVDVSGFSHRQADRAIGLCLLLWVSLVGIALIRRSPESFALLAGPFALLVALRLADAKAMTFQMIGVFYPLALCGAASLVAPNGNEQVTNRKRSLFTALPVYGILVVLLFLHAPRFIGAFNRYCGKNTPLIVIFVRSQFDRLAFEIGQNPVYIDASIPPVAIAALVEFGRRGIPIQWSPAAWKLVFGYRRWPVPTYHEIARYRLIPLEMPPLADCDEVCKTNQFRLFKFVQK